MFAIGNCVIVGENKKGIVRFIGTTDFSNGEWIGIELNSGIGKNDGTVKGKRYFECKPNYGIFVQPGKVKLDTGRSKIPSFGLNKRTGTSRKSMILRNEGPVQEKTLKRKSLTSITEFQTILSTETKTQPIGSTTDSAAKDASVNIATIDNSAIETMDSTNADNMNAAEKRSSAIDAMNATVITTDAKDATTDTIVTTRATKDAMNATVITTDANATKDTTVTTSSAIDAMDATVIPTDADATKDATNATVTTTGSTAIDTSTVNMQSSLNTKIKKVIALKDRNDGTEVAGLVQHGDLNVLVNGKNEIGKSAVEIAKDAEKVAAEGSNARLGLQLKELNEKFIQLSAKCNTLEREKKDGAAQSLELHEMIEILTLDKETLETEKEILEERMEELEIDLESAQTTKMIAEEESSVGDLADENVKLRDALKLLHERNIAEKGEGKKDKRLLEKANGEVQRLSMLSDKQQKELETLRKESIELKEMVDVSRAYEKMVEQLSEKNIALGDQVAELKVNVETLESIKEMADEMEEQYADYETELKLEINEKHREIADLNEMIASRDMDITEQVDQMKQLQHIISQHENEMKHVQATTLQERKANKRERRSSMRTTDAQQKARDLSKHILNITSEQRFIENQMLKTCIPDEFLLPLYPFVELKLENYKVHRLAKLMYEFISECAFNAANSQGSFSELEVADAFSKKIKNRLSCTHALLWTRLYCEYDQLVVLRGQDPIDDIINQHCSIANISTYKHLGTSILESIQKIQDSIGCLHIDVYATNEIQLMIKVMEGLKIDNASFAAVPLPGKAILESSLFYSASFIKSCANALQDLENIFAQSEGVNCIEHFSGRILAIITSCDQICTVIDKKSITDKNHDIESMAARLYEKCMAFYLEFKEHIQNGTVTEIIHAIHVKADISNHAWWIYWNEVGTTLDELIAQLLNVNSCLKETQYEEWKDGDAWELASTTIMESMGSKNNRASNPDAELEIAKLSEKLAISERELANATVIRKKLANDVQQNASKLVSHETERMMLQEKLAMERERFQEALQNAHAERDALLSTKKSNPSQSFNKHEHPKNALLFKQLYQKESKKHRKYRNQLIRLQISSLCKLPKLQPHTIGPEVTAIRQQIHAIEDEIDYYSATPRLIRPMTRHDNQDTIKLDQDSQSSLTCRKLHLSLQSLQQKIQSLPGARIPFHELK